MRLERIADPAGLEALRDEWDALLASSASDSLFLTWEWLLTWWRHFAEQRRLFVLAARDGRRLVGLAPFALSWRRMAPGLGAPMIEFLGTGSVGSDYLDVLAQRGRESAVAQAVGRYLAVEGEMLSLAQLRGGGTTAFGVAAALRGRGWRFLQTNAAVSPRIRLAGHTWESYLASLGREHRYAVRRKLRSVARRHCVQLDEARTEEERREALRILVELHLARWSSRGGSNAFHTPELRAFHEEFTRLALARGWLRLFVLRLDGAPAAALYGLRRGPVFSFYQSGFDPAFARESPGLVCMALTIRRAIAEGAEEYDLLHGAETYKLHWAREALELARLELFPPRVRGVLWRHAVSLRRRAGDAIRRLLPAPLLLWIRAASVSADGRLGAADAEGSASKLPEVAA